MDKLIEQFKIQIEGHVKITEYLRVVDLKRGKNGRVVLNDRNAVHPEHASILVARAIANRENGSIYRMHFGTGGATIDSLGNIIYATPNTTGAADLNNPVYFEVVDQNSGAPSGNQMAIRHINGTLFRDCEIRCILSTNEPFGQPAFDNVGNTNVNSNQFRFDEIALKTEDGLLVTHITFSPVSKTANRILEIVYTLRIRINQ